MNDENKHTRRLGILTSGGDAPGMNSALRAAVRTALEADIEAVAISAPSWSRSWAATAAIWP